MPRKPKPVNGILPCGAKSIRLCGCDKCKAFQAEQSKQRRARMSEKGLCETCGALEALHFSVRCALCYLKDSVFHSRKRMGAVNLCTVCHKPFHNAANCDDYKGMVAIAMAHGFDYEGEMMKLHGHRIKVRKALLCDR